MSAIKAGHVRDTSVMLVRAPPPPPAAAVQSGRPSPGPGLILVPGHNAPGPAVLHYVRGTDVGQSRQLLQP